MAKSIVKCDMLFSHRLPWLKCIVKSGIHFSHRPRKISSGIGAIKKAKEFVDRNTLVLIYKALIQPHLDNSCEVWDVIGKRISDRLQKLQNRAARIIMIFQK